ncbi:hypothetical protein F751_4299 [Auxenochlorella protothecoides]|uniref:Uncharacterized protein n=1 Tax=Auxenochlorella protothecoides TaxID=3075 RepID=A0A087SSX0_AUXPR|nr:hypothetical protein F751_4299 [Auxenochlorella protothecoides]KFM28824.1 hypothetical protein F751_4299 [Auxenochlorella protothecoides]
MAHTLQLNPSHRACVLKCAPQTPQPATGSAGQEPCNPTAALPRHLQPVCGGNDAWGQGLDKGQILPLLDLVLQTGHLCRYPVQHVALPLHRLGAAMLAEEGVARGWELRQQLVDLRQHMGQVLHQLQQASAGGRVGAGGQAPSEGVGLCQQCIAGGAGARLGCGVGREPDVKFRCCMSWREGKLEGKRGVGQPSFPGGSKGSNSGAYHGALPGIPAPTAMTLFPLTAHGS